MRSLQTELQRVGCYPGATDGEWKGQTRGALTEFARQAKLDLYTEKPSLAALDALRAHRQRVCPIDCGAGKVERDGKCVAATPSPSARHKSTEREPRAVRRTGKEKSGMCWAESPGRGFEFVSCDDPRARQKAF